MDVTDYKLIQVYMICKPKSFQLHIHILINCIYLFIINLMI